MNGKNLYEAIDLVKDEYINEVYNIEIKNNLTRKKLFLLILAATMAISILTACAAEIYEWDGRLSEMLNLSSEQNKLVEGMWYKINKSKTSKGITVTLDSIIADDNSMFVLFEVKLPESMDMDRTYYFEINQIDDQQWFSYLSSISSASTRINTVKVDKEKHTISYVMEYSATSGSLKEQKMRFWFNDLRSFRNLNNSMTDDRLEEAVDFVFYYDIRFTPKVINYSLDKQFSGLLNTVIVENITITPISLTINGSGQSKITLWDTNTKEHEKDFVSAVILNDGTKVELRDPHTSSSRNNLSYKALFNEVINPTEIAELEFFENGKVTLSDKQYITGLDTDLSSYKRFNIIRELSILITILLITLDATLTLHFCKNDIYKSFEKIQEKKERKGKEYNFYMFCSYHKKVLIIYDYCYIFYTFILLLAVCRLTYLIIINRFLTMTVFMDGIFIGLIILLIISIKEIRKKRRCLNINISE